jgi:hypothetical protein
LLLTVLATKTARRAGIAALVVVTAVSTLLSASGTAVMTFFVGALVLALATLSLKAVRLLVTGGWIVAVLLAVPLGGLPYKLGWENWRICIVRRGRRCRAVRIRFLADLDARRRCIRLDRDAARLPPT